MNVSHSKRHASSQITCTRYDGKEEGKEENMEEGLGTGGKKGLSMLLLGGRGGGHRGTVIGLIQSESESVKVVGTRERERWEDMRSSWNS